MTDRHAAALALMVWYLIVPPLSPQSGISDPSMPLHHWKILGSFTTAKDCEKIRTLMIQPPGLPAVGDLSHDFLCIANDDGRLKSKRHSLSQRRLALRQKEPQSGVSIADAPALDQILLSQWGQLISIVTVKEYNKAVH